MQVCGGLTRFRMRPDPNAEWLRRRREARPVPQAEPLMGTALTGSPTTVRTSRKTRPEIVAATGTLYGNRSTAEVPGPASPPTRPPAHNSDAGSPTWDLNPRHHEPLRGQPGAPRGAVHNRADFRRMRLDHLEKSNKTLRGRHHSHFTPAFVLAGPGEELEHRHRGPLKPPVERDGERTQCVPSSRLNRVCAGQGG
jgi:hypothetical protein